MSTVHKIIAITLALFTALSVVAFAASSDITPAPNAPTAEGVTPELPHAHDKIDETDGESEEIITQEAEDSESENVKSENTEIADGNTEGTEAEDNPSDTPVDRILDVPYINQRSGFPNGCESVSTVMALQHIGVEITPNDFIEGYLDMGNSLYWKNGEANACDPRAAFPGDPRNDSGWGCYPEVIKNAVDKMELEGFEAVILKDTPLSTLCSEYIDNGIPVIFWGTIDMREPSSWVTWRIDDGSGRTHTWISPFHCLLLVGYDSEYYYFNDPWRSKDKRYGRDDVEKAYSGIGREALVLLSK